MSQKFTPELIDRYLKRQLSESEQLAFDAQLRQDPLLSNEIKWQQDIHQALVDTRRNALKSRLDQVPVNATYSYGSLKVAAVVATLLIAVGGLYYTYTQSPVAYEPFYSDKAPARIAYQEVYTIRQPTVKLEASSDHSPSTIAPVSVKEETVAVAPKAPKNTTATQPQVVSSFAEETPDIDYRDFEAPEKQALQGNDYASDDVAIEALVDSKYDFHYQFYDNKLYLHGDFQGTPYKIIALNTSEDKKLFLEFDGQYYHINRRTEPTPLLAIADPALIQDLQQLGKLR